MFERKPRVYYVNNIEGDVYRVDAVGFTKDTGEKRCMLRNLTDGKFWDIPAKDLEEVRPIDGKITTVWERMPDGWYPKKEERPYPGYTDDARSVVKDGYNVYGQRVNSTMPAINRFNRERAGFKR